MNKLIVLGLAATLGAAKLAFFPANPPVDLLDSSDDFVLAKVVKEVVSPRERSVSYRPGQVN